MKHQSALVIELGLHGAAEAPAFMQQLAGAGMRAHLSGPGEAVGYLQRVSKTEDEPALVLIGPGVNGAAAVARRLRAVWPAGHLIFVRRAEQLDQLRRELSRNPMIGAQWSLAGADDPALPQLISDAARLAKRRARLRTTIDRANVQIAAQKAIDGIEYRRLLVSDHYLASFLAQTKDAIVALDGSLHVLYWNAGAERLFGYAASAAANLPASRLPFWSPAMEEHVLRLRAGATSLHGEFTCHLPHGESALEIGFSSVRDEIGSFIGVSLVIRDVSQRRRLLEAERAAQREVTRQIDLERLHLRTLFDEAPGFIAAVRGPEHVFELANRAYYQLVGHRDLIGKPVRDALPELAGQGFFELLDEVYASKKPYIGRAIEVSLQRKPGSAAESLFVDFVYQPVIEPDGRVSGIFCQGHDVSEQKRAQDALAQHQAQLEELVAERTRELEKTQLALHQSQKLEAIGKLTGGVAHDFNNILQVVAGNLELLQVSLAGNSEAQTRLRTAIAAVDRGAKLSSQLLAYARRQPLQPKVTNLARQLNEMDDLLRRVLGEAIEIESVVTAGLWNTLVDPHQLENVVLNLAINARDAMHGSGKLTLELGNAMLDDYYVQDHPGTPPGQYVMLAVSDTGAGMSPEVMNRAFDPFFTTKPEGEGTGLGLSMVYGFVKQSEGHIKLYSEVGHGTTIKIYLPRAYQAEAYVENRLPASALGGVETILVVEDDLSVQATVVDMLSGLGYRVLKAKDGESALTVLTSGVQIDLLFTDVVMPGPVRSPELAAQAKQLLPDIEVLFTSGYTQNAIVHGGRLDPGVELISKPYRREDLARKIRQMLGRRSRPEGMPVALPSSAAQPAMAAIPDPAPQPAAPRPDKPAGAALRILVVEDNDDAQTMLCELLGLLGHVARGVGTAEEALEVLDDEQFNVLITDVTLPGKSGIELARTAAQCDPKLTIVFTSGYDVEPQADFKSFSLPKPFDLARLQAVLALAG